MNKLRLYYIALFALFITGCANPNNFSISTLQDEKNIQYRESEYTEILIQKEINIDNFSNVKNKLRYITQECVKGNTLITDYVYINEKYSTNSWFEISDNSITIENNVRNIIKKKDDLSSEALNLGGTQGNRMFKISLPYKVSKLNDTTYKLIIYNNENINVIESINNSTGNPYESTVYNSDINDFKKQIVRMAKCI